MIPASTDEVSKTACGFRGEESWSSQGKKALRADLSQPGGIVIAERLSRA